MNWTTDMPTKPRMVLVPIAGQERWIDDNDLDPGETDPIRLVLVAGCRSLHWRYCAGGYGVRNREFLRNGRTPITQGNRWGRLVRPSGATILSWTIERPAIPGFYWFKGTVTFTSAARDIILATVVEVTGFAPNVKVWFPQKDMPIPICECEGR